MILLDQFARTTEGIEERNRDSAFISLGGWRGSFNFECNYWNLIEVFGRLVDSWNRSLYDWVWYRWWCFSPRCQSWIINRAINFIGSCEFIDISVLYRTIIFGELTRVPSKLWIRHRFKEFRPSNSRNANTMNIKILHVHEYFAFTGCRSTSKNLLWQPIVTNPSYDRLLRCSLSQSSPEIPRGL